MKCIFKSYMCEGRLNLAEYEKPYDYHWPMIYVCKYHKDNEITWEDALNSQSNVLVSNIKMTHTEKLGSPQALDFWIGNCEEIIFCPVCNGTGEIGYAEDLRSVKPCDECKCTGRLK